MVPLDTLNNFVTYDYLAVTKPDGSKRYVRSGSLTSLDNVIYYARFDAELNSTLPRGYIFPAAFKKIADNLIAHGVNVTTLEKSKTYSGEVFTVTKLEKASQAFQGHAIAKLDGTWKTSSKKFKKGDYVVDAAQPLANLIFYLLEPQSDDGLATWNFFDDYLEENNVGNQPVDFPIFKYFK
ncbi:MAG: hypothetical protein HC811_08380 [Flammeovirgaceae bacterium]|nr:hypothetical protein [Flammeovirgaceae bacterium]